MTLCLISDRLALCATIPLLLAPAEMARGGTTEAPAAVVEMVSFRLTAGADTADFLTAARATEAPLRRQPGFQRRVLTLAPDGTWTDLVEWADLAAAEAGAQAMMAEPAFQPFLAMIDMASVQMAHPAVQWRMD